MVPELNFNTVQSLVRSSEPYPVDFDYFWQWCGYSEKGMAKRSLRRNFNETIDFMVFGHMTKNPLGGRPTEQIKLTVNCAKKMAMMARTVKGDEVREYFLRCELVKDYALGGALNETLIGLVSRVEELEQAVAQLRIPAAPSPRTIPQLPALAPAPRPAGFPALSDHALILWAYVCKVGRAGYCMTRETYRNRTREQMPHVWQLDSAIQELISFGLLRVVGLPIRNKPESFALTEFGASQLQSKNPSNH
jgi:phage anti-repressor protein